MRDCDCWFCNAMNAVGAEGAEEKTMLSIDEFKELVIKKINTMEAELENPVEERALDEWLADLSDEVLNETS